MIELRHINKRYMHEMVLEDISITLPDTGIIGLLGKSGSGKSTLLHIISGLDLNYEGEILVDEKRCHLNDERRISIILQRHELISWLSVHHNIRLYDDFHSSLFPSISLFHIDDYKSKAVKLLSVGQKQRIAINRSFYYKPDILLCDEPTASLDYEMKVEVMRTLKEYGKDHLVFIASHDEELIRKYCDDILYLEDGRMKGNIKHNNQRNIYEPKRDYSRFIILLFSIIKGHLKDVLRLCFVFFVTMCMLMCSINVTCSFKQEIENYLKELLPTDALSFKCATCPLSLDKEKHVSQLFLYPKDYELLGISSNKDHYDQRESIEIMDESQGIKSLYLGRYPQHDNEIVLSLALSSRLGDKVIGKSYYLYYHHEKKVRGVKVKVVGISRSKLNEIYYKRRGNLSLIEKCFHKKVNYQYGILYYNKKIAIDYLRKKYPDIQFKKVGKKSQEHVSKFFNKIESILFLFSSLAIVSTIFFMCAMIDELIRKMRRDIALFYCVYAKRRQIKRLYYLIVIICFIFSSICSYFIINYLMIFMNKHVINQMINAHFVLRWPYNILIKMIITSFIIVCFISRYALNKQLRKDVINVLKDVDEREKV